MTAAAAAFTAIGTSDSDLCFCCGRENLKRAILVAPVLDADGLLGEAVPYGSTCAARATGRPSRELVAEAAAADTRRAAAVAEAADFAAGIAREWGDKSPKGLVLRTKALAGRRADALGDSDYHRLLAAALRAL
jgi:GAF domain-containing protein